MATFPVARGANGQPPRPPTEASRTAAPASTAAHAHATPVWRVSWKWPPTGTPRIETRSSSRRTGAGVATPIVSARTTSPAPAATSRSARSATTPGSTSPSKGQPNETLIVAVDGRSATARIRSTRAAASSRVALPLRWLNDSVAASVTLTRPSACRREPLPAALVEDEAGELRLDGAHRGDDLLRAGHLRHALRIDEADRLDPRQPRGGQPADELRPHVRRERLRLVLEPVPRADVAERHAHAGA